ncbi:MAG: hypothetical protein ACRDTU_08285 [Micromonosporaceae bacterium]
MTSLELRYRRLLAWYPNDFRATYEEEMVGVLMEGSRPEQRYPEPNEVASLAGGALRRRLGGVGDGVAGLFADRRWRDTAAVFGVLAALALLAERLRGVLATVEMIRVVQMGSSDDPAFPRMVTAAISGQWLPVSGAVVVAVAVLAGWRLVAATAAWVTAAGLLVMPGIRYTGYPEGLVYETVPLVLTVTMAAALSVPNPGSAGRRLLGWPRIGLLLAVGAVWVALGPATGYPLLAPDGTDDVTVIAALVLGPALLWFLLRRVESGVLRRMVALIAPTVAVILLIKIGFAGFIQSSPRFYPTPVQLVPGQWLALALTPLLVFSAGAVLVRRQDETERLVTLGRAAETPARQGGLSSADE